MDKQTTGSPHIDFKPITAQTVVEVCELSDTLTPHQRAMVADNALSIAQAHFSESAWMRAIYADETPIGFIMTHTCSDCDDGIDCAGVFLWRFMIAGPFQGKGYGRKAVDCLLAHLRAQGVTELYTSSVPGEHSPEGFYKKLGFVPTGEYYDDEIELVLNVQTYIVNDTKPVCES